MLGVLPAAQGSRAQRFCTIEHAVTPSDDWNTIKIHENTIENWFSDQCGASRTVGLPIEIDRYFQADFSSLNSKRLEVEACRMTMEWFGGKSLLEVLYYVCNGLLIKFKKFWTRFFFQSTLRTAILSFFEDETTRNSRMMSFLKDSLSNGKQR